MTDWESYAKQLEKELKEKVIQPTIQSDKECVTCNTESDKCSICRGHSLWTTKPNSMIRGISNLIKANPRIETDVKTDDENYEFWKNIIYTDGKLDEHKVLNELHDYKFLMESVPEVYMEVTGGKVSKQNTMPDVVIDLFHDYVNELIKENYEDEDIFNILTPLAIRHLNETPEHLPKNGSQCKGEFKYNDIKYVYTFLIKKD